MAFSDTLFNAAIELQKGAEWYGRPDYPIRYSGIAVEWVKQVARVLAVAAGHVQDGQDDKLPALPDLGGSTTFIGLQLCHPANLLDPIPDEIIPMVHG